jgi:hypothetical protein
MALFAVINDNSVSNVIVCDTKELAETLTNQTCVEYTEDSGVAIGWTYADGVFTAPIVEETPAE